MELPTSFISDFPYNLELTQTSESRNSQFKSYRVQDSAVNGEIKRYNFDDINLSIISVKEGKSLNYSYAPKDGQYILSYMFNGECEFKLSGLCTKVQSCESCAICPHNSANRIAQELKPYSTEVRIEIGHQFFKTHRLEDEISFTKEVHKNNHLFTNSLNITEKHILSDIIKDGEKSELKTLFLKGKILELIAFHLDEVPKEVNANLNSDIPERVKNIIDDHRDSFLTLGKLAKMVGTNVSTLQKLFKDQFNCTINDYVTNSKMLEARKMLMNTKEPIYSISATIGYKNPTLFSAAFKKVYKYSPRSYRSVYTKAD